MNRGAFWMLLAGTFGLMGCTVDPYIKLDKAAWLLGMNRPIPAEPLILEGKAEYEKQGSQLGLTGTGCKHF